MKKQLSRRNLLTWLDDNLLLILSGLLLVFIPLYPKIPLFSPIEQYIVRVRLEDILVLLTVLVWIVQVIRRKVVWKTPALFLVTAYLVVGLLSIISATLIQHTVPLEPLHLGKTILHYFRYIQYFSLLFIFSASINSIKQVKLFLILLITAIIGITIYGYGQKYYQWPVYSTMNREFSKGVRLVLTEHARVQSTFAGHYDLGAYLVLTLPLILSIIFIAKNKRVRLAAGLAFVLGAWLLTLSASRTSYVAFVGGITLATGFLAFKQPTNFKKLSWGVKRLIVTYLVVGLLFISYGTDMYERFLQVIQGYPMINQSYHQFNKWRKDTVNYLASQLFSLQDSGSGPAAPGQAAGPLVPSDERPIPYRPSDVYVDVPELIAIETSTGAFSVVERPRVFSECALTKGLSWCIRVETLWPQAIAGFQTNPFFGTGYATLNKETVDQFTEAESTDNNFLRTLGETGFFGFITFYGVVAYVMWQAYLLLRRQEPLSLILGAGFLAGSLGLLVNAVYIDVFASSKVAFTYWALAGIMLAYSWQVDSRRELRPAKLTRSKRYGKKN